MPASIHPPVQLHLVLDERSYDEGGSLEMARRFTAVAPTEVVRASKGLQRANVLRFDVGDDVVTGEAERNPLWRDALAAWLDEEFAETSALVARENDARRNNGEEAVRFAWAEVKFGSGPVIAVRMKDSVIPPEAAGFVARARTLLAQGAFGYDPIASIRIPACASIAAQRAEAPDAADATDKGSLEALRAVGREERGSSSASDIVEALEEAAGIDDELEGGRAASNPDGQNAWATTGVQHDGPSRAELDEALAEAEAALRRGDDPTDVDSEERDAQPSDMVASVRTDVPPVHVVRDQAERSSDREGKRTGGGEGEYDGDREGERNGAGERGGESAHDADSESAGITADADADARNRASAPRPTADPHAEACALVDENVPDNLDYRIWNVAYADGTSVRYDSVLGEALLD